MSLSPLNLAILNTHLHSIDNQCFYTEDAWIYLKCKLPFSILATVKSTNSNIIHHRVLSVRLTSNLLIETNINVLFSIDKRVERLEETNVDIERINCTKNDLTHETNLFNTKYDRLILNETYNHYLNSSSSTNAQVTFQNKTHAQLVYVLESPRLNANTLIWPIVLANRSDICSFKLNGANDLFELDTTGLLLKTFVSWSLPWSHFALSYKYSLVLESNECYSNKTTTTFVAVDVTFSLKKFAQMNLMRSDVPVPRLARVYYDLQLQLTNTTTNSSLVMLMKTFDIVLVYDLKRLNENGNDNDEMLKQFYNVTYSLVKKSVEDEEDEYEEIPFYIDPLKGELFYTRSSSFSSSSSTTHGHRVYELKVEIKFNFVYNDSLSFSLFPNVRVNVTSTMMTMRNSKGGGALSTQIRKDQSDNATIHGTLDLSLSITSTDLREFLKCPMLGQFRFFPTASTTSPVSYKLVLPKVMAPKVSKTPKIKGTVKDQGQKYKNVYKYSSKTRKRTSKVRAKVSLNLVFFFLIILYTNFLKKSWV